MRTRKTKSVKNEAKPGERGRGAGGNQEIIQII
jgi:hypothetical protein